MREDMAANGGTGTEEHDRTATNCFRHRNMSASPRICSTTMRKDLPENCQNENEIGNEDNKHLTRCLSTSFCSTTCDDHIVEELKVRDYENPNLALVSSPLSSRGSRRNLLGNESRYISREIAPQDEERLPTIFSKEVKANGSDFWT